MTLYCIRVGRFDRERFDFVKEISKMERLFSQTNEAQTLSDYYPPKPDVSAESKENGIINEKKTTTGFNTIELYDVLYACIDAEVSNG